MLLLTCKRISRTKFLLIWSNARTKPLLHLQARQIKWSQQKELPRVKSSASKNATLIDWLAVSAIQIQREENI